MRKNSCRYSIIFWFVAILFLFGTQAYDQDTVGTRNALRAIANGIINDGDFMFVDAKTGKHFSGTTQAPPDAHLKLESRYNDWRYWNGVLNIGMMMLGETLHNTNCIRFAEKNVAFCFDNEEYFKDRYNGENKWNYPFGEFFAMEELDDCGAMGASVIEVYRLDKQERYRAYIDRVANHIKRIQSRLNDGTLARSFPRKWTLWADDLYMSIVFLSRMGELTGDSTYFDDAAKQVINFHKYLFDDRIGLFHHCWFSDSSRPGVAFWGRANGWAMMAQLDLLDRIPLAFPKRDTLLSLLRRDIKDLVRYQGDNGLWHQLLDKPDSYSETSCTAMFTYVIAHSVNRGYVDTTYASNAAKGWEGIRSKIGSDGQIEGVCTGTGIGDDLDFYYKRPTPLNDVHGIGGVMLAGAEMLQVKR